MLEEKNEAMAALQKEHTDQLNHHKSLSQRMFDHIPKINQLTRRLSRKFVTMPGSEMHREITYPEK